jgi:Methylase involved in ubiquinone/menaquinone biosynthesis
LRPLVACLLLFLFMKQKINPPKTGLVLEIGSGDNPNPRSDILVDRYINDNTERGGNIVIDRPLIVADAHHLPFRDGVFSYVIGSHILEHMDDPEQFARELVRVGKAGYLGSPSEIAERMFHWSFHRWYVNLIDDTLVLHPKEQGEPFGELFDYMYEYNPLYYLFQRSMPSLFWVEKEWKGEIKIKVTDKSPLQLKDPQTLKRMVQPEVSLPTMFGMFVSALLSRFFRAETRAKIRKFFKRSYV